MEASSKATIKQISLWDLETLYDAATALETLAADNARLEARVRELEEWQNKIMDAAKSVEGEQAHRILPVLWPIISEEYVRRAALSQEKDTFPTPEPR